MSVRPNNRCRIVREERACARRESTTRVVPAWSGGDPRAIWSRVEIAPPLSHPRHVLPPNRARCIWRELLKENGTSFAIVDNRPGTHKTCRCSSGRLAYPG